MKKPQVADEVGRLRRKVDRDLAKGVTISDISRKIGIAETTYYRWRQRHDPAHVDTDRRSRELQIGVKRIKRLVAELLQDKQMLQDIAKKNRELQIEVKRIKRLLAELLRDKQMLQGIAKNNGFTAG